MVPMHVMLTVGTLGVHGSDSLEGYTCDLCTKL
jgi:hypothetical protein